MSKCYTTDILAHSIPSVELEWAVFGIIWRQNGFPDTKGSLLACMPSCTWYLIVIPSLTPYPHPIPEFAPFQTFILINGVQYNIS